MNHADKQRLLNRLNFSTENLQCAFADRNQAIKSIAMWKREIAAIEQELGLDKE